MDAVQACPECGAKLPSDAPGGLCPKCLIAAALDESGATTAYGNPGIDDPARASAPSIGRARGGRPAEMVDLERFKRAVLDLGLLRDGEFERFVSGAFGGVPGLAKALVRAGKLTAYQASALAQGKARGLVIGNYFVLDKLGAGGMGVVFKARHRRLGRVVALKMLPPSLARDPGLYSRFRREVDVAARLSHPNIVPVLDADEDRGVPFMTMEYIEGNDLDRLVRDGGVLAVEQALDCVIQAARGLEAVHAQGIVHRDIKPGNLMLDAQGLVRVLDLGLARLIEASNPFGETAEGPLTKSGTYMGTVDFMAPEQGIDSSRVDHRADIYSLGCSLCYLLTGRPPFDGPNVLARLMAHQDQPASSLLARRPEVPRAIDAAYREMMAKEPDARPSSMTEVIRRLEACRASASSAAEARSGLLEFAQTVVLKRALPRSKPGTSVFARDLPAGSEANPDLEIEDLVLDYRDEAHHTWTAQPRPDPNPAPTALARARTGRPRPPRRRGRPALALGVLALLAVAGLVYSVTPKGPAKPGTDRLAPNPEGQSPSREAVRDVTPDSTSSSTAGATPDRSSTPPRSYSTFDVATAYSLLGPDRLECPVNPIAVSADGSRVLVGSWAEHAYLVDVDAGAQADVSLDSDGWQGAWPYSMAISADGKRALIGTVKVAKPNIGRAKVSRDAGFLRFWDLTKGRQFHPRQQPYDNAVHSVAISSDGRRGLTGGLRGELTVWDVDAGKSLRTLGPQKGSVPSRGLAFYPDGRRAVSADGGLLHLWDTETGTEVASWDGHGGTICAVAMSTDGRRIVTGGHDGRVILRDAETGAILKTFELPANDNDPCVTFDSDGNIVAAGNGIGGPRPRPGHLIVWDARTFGVLRQDEKPFIGHLALAALPGGRLLTGDEYGLRLWTPRPSVVDAPRTPAARDGDSTPVNLLALGGAQQSRERWQARDGSMISAVNGASHLTIHHPLPSDYRIDMVVSRIGEGDRVAVGLRFPVDGRPTYLLIDKPAENNIRSTGLDGLDGVPFTRSGRAHRGRLFTTTEPARISLTVHRGSIRLTFDGTTVLDWKGDPKRLIPHLGWHLRDPRDFDFVAAGSFRVHELTLTPLAGTSP